MTIFRWIMGSLSMLLAAASLICFVIYIAMDIDAWLQRTRFWRRGLYMSLLFWFNIEVWGRVVWTLIHW